MESFRPHGIERELLVLWQMKPFMNCVEREFEAVGNAELVEDVMQVVFYRLLADEHLLCHLAVLVALGNKTDNLTLALAERAPLAVSGSRMCSEHLSRGRELPHYCSGGVGVQPNLTRVDLADRFHYQFRSSLLQNNP